MSGDAPARRCVVCGSSFDKWSLLRFVVAGDDSAARLQWDCQQQLPGRGAYVCRAVHCVLGKRSGERLLQGLSPASDAERKKGERIDMLAVLREAEVPDVKTADKERFIAQLEEANAAVNKRQSTSGTGRRLRL